MGKATYTVTVTNNSNGVSVDYETEAPMELLIPDVAADVVKDLVNTVRAYDTENEHEVCGWHEGLVFDHYMPDYRVILKSVDRHIFAITG